MANIAKMEMASALFEKDFIKVEKCFLGLSTKVTYLPTNSPVKGVSLDFDAMNGQRLAGLILAKSGEFEAAFQKNGMMQSCDNGNSRVTLCFSQDRQFVALQLFQFSNFSYHSVGEIRFFEGSDATKVLHLFVK